ncbi:MAG: TIGR01777 family oxidoreductase [Actinomycetes bacterium]
MTQIAVTGASGFLGSAVVEALRADGAHVLRLVRRTPATQDEVQWDPNAGTVDVNALTGTDAVIHLAGAGVGDHRWTPAYKQEILTSRVEGTRTIAAACAAMTPRPRVLLSSSAIGYYGDTGESAVDESAPPGSGFLADVTRAWEPETKPADAAGVRVVHMRTGVILSSRGGTLGGTVHVLGVPIKLLTLFKAGLAGPLGSGRQWVSWMSLTDYVAAVRFLLANDDVYGPVNLTAPQPVRSKEWVRAIGRAVHRPTVLPVPCFALRAAIGPFADEAVLSSGRVLPRRLEAAGFQFTHRDIDTALAAELG